MRDVPEEVLVRCGKTYVLGTIMGKGPMLGTYLVRIDGTIEEMHPLYFVANTPENADLLGQVKALSDLADAWSEKAHELHEQAEAKRQQMTPWGDEEGGR